MEDVVDKVVSRGAHDLLAAVQFHAFFEDVVMRDLDVLDQCSKLGCLVWFGAHGHVVEDRGTHLHASGGPQPIGGLDEFDYDLPRGVVGFEDCGSDVFKCFDQLEVVAVEGRVFVLWPLRMQLPHGAVEEFVTEAVLDRLHDLLFCFAVLLHADAEVRARGFASGFSVGFVFYLF